MKEIRYWFSEWSCVCVKDGKGFYVINGDWKFYYDKITQLRYFDKELTELVSSVPSDVRVVSKVQFDKEEPNFGHW